MEPIVTGEFFRTDAAFSDLYHNDFTDNAALSPTERLDFLTHYAAFLQQHYTLSALPQKVVDPKEAEEMLARFGLFEPLPRLSRRIDIDSMQAAVQKQFSPFAGWMLYTPYAVVEEETVCFRRHDLPPTPAAKYVFDDKQLRSFTFSFYMDAAYRAPIAGGILDITPGRTVELRHGIEDVVRLQLYSDGTCCARLADRCPYHPENVVVGHFAFDAWQTVTLALSDTAFTVTMNGKTSPPLALSAPCAPDTLFVGCGMFHVGEWKFRPLSMTFADGEQTQFFLPSTATPQPPVSLGIQTLPFAIGGEIHCDETLILTKDVDIPKGGRVRLHIDALDPHGDIYVNDRLVKATDGFAAQDIDITPYIQKGRNRLRLEIYPRAPEVLFCWHRQKDPYNGWFCEHVSLTVTNKTEIRALSAVAQRVESGKVTAAFSAALDRACPVSLYIRRIFPTEGEETLLGSFTADGGSFAQTLTFTAEPWSPETPVLYAVRLAACGEDGTETDDAVIETGFRTVCQKDGKILLNGVPTVLTGALLMQFLPPYTQTPTTHICAASWQILWQEMMLKRMGGNTMRLHMLGYGSNDRRFARFADRLGLLLIWTTRFIDSVEQLALQQEWAAKDGFCAQVRARINHPSIIMWEGANEFHPTLADIDRIYRQFVPAVREADSSRLLSPVSHLYYAGDLYPKDGCAFYNDAGTADQAGNPAAAAAEWNDPRVVRSAHTYNLLLGYGADWKAMRTQSWSMQPELLQSTKHAYLVSEYAVIGRQDPRTPEAREYMAAYSYETPDEDILGFRFTDAQWRESQAYQALAAQYCTKKLRLIGADGMLWCCLMSGANDGGYRKPPIDNYGYPKLAFYTLRDGFRPLQAVSDDVDVLRPRRFTVSPMLLGAQRGTAYRVTAEIRDEQHRTVAAFSYPRIDGTGAPLALPPHAVALPADGYYALIYTVSPLSH